MSTNPGYGYGGGIPTTPSQPDEQIRLLATDAYEKLRRNIPMEQNDWAVIQVFETQRLRFEMQVILATRTMFPWDEWSPGKIAAALVSVLTGLGITVAAATAGGNALTGG